MSISTYFINMVCRDLGASNYDCFYQSLKDVLSFFLIPKSDDKLATCFLTMSNVKRPRNSVHVRYNEIFPISLVRYDNLTLQFALVDSRVVVKVFIIGRGVPLGEYFDVFEAH